MKVLFLLALASAALADVDDPDTVVLTSSNFDDFVKSEQAVLVEFYAPWCGHCKNLAPEYAKAATTLKKQGIQIGKMDATEYGDVAQKYDVSGYPTMKVFRSGKPTDYNGPRDASGIVAYMRKEAAPAYVEVKSLDEAEERAKSFGAPVFVGQFANKDSAAAKTFIKVANAQRDNHFAVVYGKDDGVVAIFPDLPRYGATEKRVKFGGDATDEAALEKWTHTASFLPAGVHDATSKHIYEAADVPVVTLFVKGFDTEKDPAGTKYFVNRLKKVAKDFVGKLHFAIADAATAPFELLENVAYTVGIHHRGSKYRHDKAPAKGFDKEELAAFANSYLNGAVEEFLKSEPIPTEQGDVKVLVGKNFKAETEGKAGLIEFYAPWCGHCKSLAPTWDKLGAKVAAKAPEVLIAKMDATANDVPGGFEVTGFPTIYYVDGKGTKTKYQGGRDLKDFTRFLKDKGHM